MFNSSFGKFDRLVTVETCCTSNKIDIYHRRGLSGSLVSDRYGANILIPHTCFLITVNHGSFIIFKFFFISDYLHKKFVYTCSVTISDGYQPVRSYIMFNCVHLYYISVCNHSCRSRI